MTRLTSATLALAAVIAAPGCKQKAEPLPPRASGYVEATEVRIASKVPGRVLDVRAIEGHQAAVGETLVQLSTTDTDLMLQRVRAEREGAQAQVRLLNAGSRPEDIQQAEAQVAAAQGDRKAIEAELAAARTDEARFEQLLKSRAGTQKQRDDAVARRELAEARVKAAGDRVAALAATVARLKVGARPEELDAARARVSAIDAQIAALTQDRADATVTSPINGVISSRLVEPGELILPRAPLVVLIDLDHAWATAYVEEPLVPTLRIDQPATIVTDAGDKLPGRISFISPRAEFTPRNVQTSSERAKLVYRVKISVDNSKGILKPGMPVEVTFGSGAP